MRKLLIIFVVFVVACSIASARKKREAAGDVDNGVYKDKEYGFSLKIPEGWDYSIKQADKHVRVVLVKKEYEIPMQFQHAPGYTTIPKVTVYADTTSMPLNVFVDSILSDEYESDQKKNILTEFKILFGDFRQTARGKVTVGDLEGIQISGQQRYTIQVQKQGIESDKADVVTDFYGGSVFFTKKDNTIVMLHFISEWRYFESLEPEFSKIVNSLKL